ncbi:MAG: DUF4974 domain-containing protein [Bacteroidota bacterium]|nr:DUF4974 domain-containing protein [Bacteroidota bacterium]
MASEERIWLLISRALAGEISPAELREMESIFINEPERRADYENLKKIRLEVPESSTHERRAMERGLDKFDRIFAENEFTERSLFNHKLEPLPNRSYKGWMIAASIISLFVIGLFAVRFSLSNKVEPPQLIVADYGKRIQSTLPDGSVVWLNSGSSIKYAGYSQSGKREVTLNGEAYFDVKHDAEHPFIVHAGKLNVVVLGTAFNVKAYNSDAFIETTLIRGKVEILNDAKPGAGIVMYPNEKVRVNTEVNIVKKITIVNKQPVADSVGTANNGAVKPAIPNNEIDETAWVSNYLTFKKEGFTELAGQLERWYNVKIIFDNDKYGEKQFTGRFKDQDINEVMRALQYTQPFHYKIIDNQIHIW